MNEKTAVAPESRRVHRTGEHSICGESERSLESLIWLRQLLRLPVNLNRFQAEQPTNISVIFHLDSLIQAPIPARKVQPGWNYPEQSRTFLLTDISTNLEIEKLALFRFFQK